MTTSDASDDAEHAGSNASPSVAVCICTCRRPEGLKKALVKLAELNFTGSLQVFVVDNHPDRAGEAVCANMAATYRYPLICTIEPRAGISHARNAVLREALKHPVAYVAMIDDDEWPEPDWLDLLLEKRAESEADVVGGPTLPAFEVPPPNWMIKGRMFQTSSMRLSFGTGNVLYRAAMLRECEGDIFDTRFAMSGGEDVEFARRMLALGKRFVACEEAVVYENVPRERMRRSYLISRAIRDGNVKMIWDRNQRPGWRREFIRPLFIIQKILYASEHLLFSVAQPWRLMRCALDLFQVVGMVPGLFNFTYTFYATDRGERVRLQWNPVHASGTAQK